MGESNKSQNEGSVTRSYSWLQIGIRSTHFDAKPGPHQL